MDLDRRGFFEQSVRLGALALLVGACRDLGSITGPAAGEEVLVTLADYPALAEEGGVALIAGLYPPVALANEGSGTYAALSLVCPHQGSVVRWTGSQFVCPNHGARFALDGHWTGGQPTSNLHEYPTTYDPVAGTVRIAPG